MPRKTLDRITCTNPWLVFLPFFVLYVAYALNMTPHDHLILDENRYWGFAENLLNGRYAFRDSSQFLWSGPGYPLLLMPFVAFDSPLWILKVLNALLLYASVVIFYRMLKLYIAPKQALLGAFLFACYYPMYEVALPYVMTEAWSIFLMVSTASLICRAFRFKDYRWHAWLFPGMSLALLTLTKVIFGYVLMAMVMVCLVLWILRGRSRRMWQMTKIFGIAWIFCTPYLIYTYSLTHKSLYWGNSGGLQLYWMSSPFEDELGDWHMPTLEENGLLQKNHGAFFSEISGLGEVEKDEALKRRAIEQIKAHPKKFAYNWVANVGRTFFSHPLSFLKPSNGLFYYLVPNIFLIVFATLMAILTVLYYKRFPLEILVLLVFSLLYLGGISFLASYVRFLYPIVPIWMVWIAWGLHRFVRLNLGKQDQADFPQRFDQ
ncbi:MAG: hypothetical protein RLZZ165_466 [Bacteroidota bacterium]